MQTVDFMRTRKSPGFDPRSRIDWTTRLVTISRLFSSVYDLQTIWIVGQTRLLLANTARHKRPWILYTGDPSDGLKPKD